MKPGYYLCLGYTDYDFMAVVYPDMVAEFETYGYLEDGTMAQGWVTGYIIDWSPNPDKIIYLGEL